MVPFRFAKQFTGTVREGDVDSQEVWSYFAAPVPKTASRTAPISNEGSGQADMLAIAPVGRGELMAIGARDYFEFGFKELQTDPWLSAKGPPAPPEVIFRDEPQWWERQGKAQPQS